MDRSLLCLDEPLDYWTGVGDSAILPIPRHILLFSRRTRERLQQEALQNRSHHRFVLMVNLQTSGTVHVDHLLMPLHPGEGLLVLPYQFHHFSHLATDTMEWVFCTFEMEDQTFLEPFRNRVFAPRRGSMHALELLLTEWRRCNEMEPRGEMQEMQLQTVLLYLLISLRDDLQAQAPDRPPAPEGKLLRTIYRLLWERGGQPVSIADLADALEMSPSRLRARFRETAGVPLGRYLLNYRLNRAMALLRTTNRSIADVAEDAGFGSPQAFSRLFKQKMDCTPRAYRHGVTRPGS